MILYCLGLNGSLLRLPCGKHNALTAAIRLAARERKKNCCGLVTNDLWPDANLRPASWKPLLYDAEHVSCVGKVAPRNPTQLKQKTLGCIIKPVC